MEFTMKGMALLTSFFGIVSFVCGVVAENKKPASGTVIQGKDVVICKYSSDPMLYLGYISFGFLLLCTIVGFKSISYPYRKKSIPYSALFGTKTMSIFFSITWLTGGLAAALILWPTITEQLHHTNNVHKNLDYTCPTAKTGLIGGGAFVSLSPASSGSSASCWLTMRERTTLMRWKRPVKETGPKSSMSNMTPLLQVSCKKSTEEKK